VDDSIVRGDQAKVIARKLQEAGTSSVFYASTAPPYINTCYLGINTPDRHRLVAFGCTPELVRQKIGAEVLHYLSLESSFEVLGSRDFCTGCFTGQYPVPVPEESQPEV
jgi:amidophosphoribosyltransferase